MDQLFKVLVEQGLSTVLAMVFIFSYFDDKKNDKEYKILQLEHEKELAVIMRDSSRIMEDLKVINDETVTVHRDLDTRVKSLDDKLNKLLEQSNHYETIQAITEVKTLLSDLMGEMGM